MRLSRAREVRRARNSHHEQGRAASKERAGSSSTRPEGVVRRDGPARAGLGQSVALHRRSAERAVQGEQEPVTSRLARASPTVLKRDTGAAQQRMQRTPVQTRDEHTTGHERVQEHSEQADGCRFTLNRAHIFMNSLVSGERAAPPETSRRRRPPEQRKRTHHGSTVVKERTLEAGAKAREDDRGARATSASTARARSTGPRTALQPSERQTTAAAKGLCGGTRRTQVLADLVEDEAVPDGRAETPREDLAPLHGVRHLEQGAAKHRQATSNQRSGYAGRNIRQWSRPELHARRESA